MRDVRKLRDGGVSAVGDAVVVAVAPDVPAPAAAAPARAPARVAAAPVAPAPIGRPPAGLDRATWERFRRAELAPARILDLHGMTAPVAHEAVVAFILAAHANRLRCVEIVTGRGSAAGTGTLRREFPHWIAGSALAGLVLAAAHPRGNAGATRLLLRRARPERGVSERGVSEQEASARHGAGRR